MEEKKIIEEKPITEEETPKKNKTKIIIIIIAIFIIISSSCIVIFSLKMPDDSTKYMKDTSKNDKYITDAKAFATRVEYMKELSKYNDLFKGNKIYLKDIVDITNNYRKDPYEGEYNLEKSYIILKNNEEYIYLTSCRKNTNNECVKGTTYSIGASNNPIKVSTLKKEFVK